jgi:acetyl-CoA C-acetyltransferase
LVSSNTPIIVGVGQFTERLDDPAYAALAPADIAARACEAAIADAGGSVRGAIDLLGAVRTFEDSRAGPGPFGKPNKFPLAIARRLGIEPRTAILEKAGGQSPLTVIADLAERLRRGEGRAARAVGSEAISTVRHLSAKGETRDWAEDYSEDIEDHGHGLEGLLTPYDLRHGLTAAPYAYALLENARRARLGMTRDAYALAMGQLFAPFTRVAAANPYSSASTAPMTAQEIFAVGERNRMIADPFRLKMVSRDQVNQGAAVLVTTVATARELGIPETKWLYLHGAGWAIEPPIVEREDPGAYPAARLAFDAALSAAGKTADQIDHFDFYSCFPIAVFSTAVDILGIDPADPRELTVTGGLPYFGGPGNNYSMHAITTMSEQLRAAPGDYGLIGLNGGMQTKYGAMVLSTEPAEWPGLAHDTLQAERRALPGPAWTENAEGDGRIVTYTVIYIKGEPTRGVIVGELDDGTRFLANAADAETLASMIAQDPLGRRVEVRHADNLNAFVFGDRDGGSGAG